MDIVEIVENVLKYIDEELWFVVRLVSKTFMVASRMFFNDKNKVKILELACRIDYVDIFYDLELLNLKIKKLIKIAYLNKSKKILKYFLDNHIRFLIKDKKIYNLSSTYHLNFVAIC